MLTEAQKAVIKTAGIEDPDTSTMAEITAAIEGLEPDMRALFDQAGASDAAADVVDEPVLMDDEATTEAAPAEEPMQAAASSVSRQALTAAAARGRSDALARFETAALAAKVGGHDSAWITKQVKSNLSLSEIRQLGLDAKVKNEALPGLSVSVGDHIGRATIVPALSDAILLKAGQKVTNPHARANELRGLSLCDMSRAYLGDMGLPAQQLLALGKNELISLMFRQGVESRFPQLVPALAAQGTGSFADVLANTQNKAFLGYYEEIEAAWQQIFKIVERADFKTGSSNSISDMGALGQIADGGEIQRHTLTDTKESYAIADHAGLLSLTRQALINDDLGVFDSVARIVANAAARTEADKAWAVITDNAAMDQDAVALFHANHSNLAASGAALSVTTLSAAVTALRKQTGPGGVKLNIRGAHLVVPAALETTADTIVNSTETRGQSGVEGVHNPHGGKFNVVVDPRLDDNSATAWYVVGDPTTNPALEFAYLSGERGPVIDQEVDFATKSVKTSVIVACGADAVDYRPVYKNAGA